MRSSIALSVFLAASVLAGCQTTTATTEESCDAYNKKRHLRIWANNQCMVIRAYGKPAAGNAMVVFLHGDTKVVADYMSGSARQFRGKGVVGAALIRPGYSDSYGDFTPGRNNTRGGHYGSEGEAAAIKALKDHYKADYVILAGRSGGSAVAGVIIGKYPGLVDAVVLGACPCNVGEWRSYRGWGGYNLSPSPHEFAGSMAKNAKIVAITGSNDKNTPPILAKGYVNDLKENGVDATFIELPGEGHSSIENTSEYLKAIDEILKAAGRVPPPRKFVF